MTSTPRKLKIVEASQRHKNDGQISIDSFDELVIALTGDTRFINIDFESPDSGVISLSKGDASIILLNDNVWQDTKAVTPFLDSPNSNSLTLVLCGSEEQHEGQAAKFNKPNIHNLALPINISNLNAQLTSLFSTQTQEDERRQSDENISNIKYVLSVSRELNKIRDVDKLLGLILQKAREVTSADAGSIYVVNQATEEDDGNIEFKIAQNDSVPQNLSQFKMPLNGQSIVGSVALKEKSLNIPDLRRLHEVPEADGMKHDRSWEERISYQCRSMLTLPMFDISHTVIGVIQLINCKQGNEALRAHEHFEERVLPFNDIAVEYAEIVAHQAGIALENAMLTEEKEKLFEGFVDAAVKAIEQRDPTTSGHSHRVATLTLEIANLVNRETTGIYKDIFFNEDSLKEIEYASLLHDFGKISVREKVLLKAKKLYPWEMENLLERFELIKARYEIDFLKDFVNYLQAPNLFPPGLSPSHFERQKEQKLKVLNSYLDFILQANEPTVLEQGGFEKLKDLANLTFKDMNNGSKPFLKNDELKALSVSRGSLTRRGVWRDSKPRHPYL